MKYLIFVLLLFSGCEKLSVQAGTVYHISPSGSNSNSGTITSPWQTLSYACSRATATGDEIHVTAGIYTESSMSNLAVGVSVTGEVGSIIRSTITTQYSYVLSLSSGSNTNGNQRVSGLKFISATPYAAFAAVRVVYRNNVEITNCEFTEFNYHAISLENGQQSVNFATGNKIHDCVITNCAAYIGTYPSGDSKGSVNIDSQNGLLIYNNTITVDRPDGKNGNCIDAVQGFLKNVKVYNNTFTKVYKPGTWDFAIEYWNLYEGNEIYNNEITGSVDICRAWGGSPYCVWVHDNRIGQNSLIGSQSIRGVLLEITHRDVIIERNFIKNVASGVFVNLGYTTNQQTNVRISYNIFYNIGALVNSTGWGVYYSIEQTEDRQQTVIDNVIINNNVFIGSSNSSYTTRYGIGLPDAGKATNVSVRNNIITNFDSYAIYGNGRDGTTIDNMVIERNIGYGNGNNNIIFTEGLSPTNSTISSNIMLNPLFVSSTDFHLQAGSPAINTGRYVNLTIDYDNKTVADPPEIGCYEFGSSHSTLGKIITSNGKLIKK